MRDAMSSFDAVCALRSVMETSADMDAILENPVYLSDEEETLGYAGLFAQSLVAPCTVALVGDLGAGKTTFVRGVLRALGITGSIKSPTYALVESYDTKKGPVHHFDAYRIEGKDDFEARGGFDYFDNRSIRLIEWPEKLEEAVKIDITVRLAFDGDGRLMTIVRSAA
jgi:tRNA threonylcarbamoyladenosine biosynthesis protein TsaE